MAAGKTPSTGVPYVTPDHIIRRAAAIAGMPADVRAMGTHTCAVALVACSELVALGRGKEAQEAIRIVSDELRALHMAQTGHDPWAVVAAGVETPDDEFLGVPPGTVVN